MDTKGRQLIQDLLDKLDQQSNPVVGIVVHYDDSTTRELDPDDLIASLRALQLLDTQANLTRYFLDRHLSTP